MNQFIVAAPTQIVGFYFELFSHILYNTVFILTAISLQ